MTASTETLPADRPVVFFDGVCGLCNSSVDFILRHDRRGKLLFAPLQGETASAMLDERDTANLGSIVLRRNGRLYRRSAAIVRILYEMGGVWPVVGGILWLVPQPLRDLLYRGVARVRYRVWGKKETCRMATPDERERFLD